MDRLVTFSSATIRNMHRARSHFDLGSSFRHLAIASWKEARLKPLKLELKCSKNFSTRCPMIIETSPFHLSSKELQTYVCRRQKRFFRSNFITFDMKSGKKPPKEDRGSAKFAPDSRAKGQCKDSAAKCIPRPSSNCRKRPKNASCPKQAQPCPPPCPCPSPEPPAKPPPPKICYRKCPPPPKLPRPPKCPKIPAPPSHPPLPKIPRLPKCPQPCPPPPPPPLPKCPAVPKCPECPPQKVCPPPPPCEPCPCPPPCPPPCCPPPPPCPPCPPQIPCPKPLPCPPPPPPIICPPCPPCAECPKPKPCPPPPPCCPCPCPEPPPPCPCPEPCPPCPPCPQISPSCPKDVPSCPKCDKDERSGKGFFKRKMSTFHRQGSPWYLAKRKLHLCSFLMEKSSSSKKPPSCKAMGDICADKKKKDCLKPCEKKSSCEEKKPLCGDVKEAKVEKKKKKDLCPDSCIPRGKCDQVKIKMPPKMVYAPTKCPTPKFVAPKPCPTLKTGSKEASKHHSFNVSEKDVCAPPPLPKAPTKPVILCPCPPPPKLHPGPCPCYAFSRELTQPIVMPPCAQKEKYPCCKEPFLCPQETKICKMEKSCESLKKKRKEKKSKQKK